MKTTHRFWRLLRQEALAQLRVVDVELPGRHQPLSLPTLPLTVETRYSFFDGPILQRIEYSPPSG